MSTAPDPDKTVAAPAPVPPAGGAPPAGDDRTLADARTQALPRTGTRTGTGTGTGTGRASIPEVEIEEEIGRGGMGVVYRGRQPYLDRRVAVKVLMLASAPNPEQFVERFRREAKILAGLAHPHIVACHQAGATAEGDCYLVMEFIDGPNLRDWVDRSGPLAEADALEVTRDIARALEHAHAQGIIHRDVKPENVLLQKMDRPPEGCAFPHVAKLVDLGLARPGAPGEEAQRLTAAGVVVGTPSTMAPEQFDDPERVDHRADIYGLGCVLYHMLAGKSAFREPSITQLMMRKASGEPPDVRADRPEVRPEVARLATDMLARRPEDRPQSYEEVLARCDEIGGGSAAVAEKGGTKRYQKAAPPAPPAAPGGAVETRRRPSRFPLVTAGIALAAAVAWFALSHAERDAARPKAAAPAAAPALAAPVEFGLAVPLFARDFAGRIADWRCDPKTWAPDEEGPGVTGQGTGDLSRAIGPGPWRVEGSVQPIVAPETGARVDLEGGGAIALALLNFEKHLNAMLVRLERDPRSGEWVRTKVLSEVRRIDRPSEDATVAFALEIQGGRIRAEAGGAPPIEAPAGGAEAAGVSLYVVRGTVRFGELSVRRPR